MTWTQQAQLRKQTIGSITCDQGKKIPRTLTLPQIGYLGALSLDTQLAFQFGTAAATSADAFAAYNGNLQRITIFVNSIGNLFDCSGFMTGIITALNDCYNYGNSVAQGLPSVFATAAGAGTSAKTNIWVHNLPISLNLRNAPWPIGLFQTALQNLSIRLIVSWLPLEATAGNPETGMYVPGGSTVITSDESGQVQINEKYFDPIADPKSQPYLGFIHRWTEFQVPLTASGDTQVLLPGQNYYTRLVFAIVTGASNSLALDSTNLTRARLMYGANLAPFDFDETKNELSNEMRRQYGNTYDTLPRGVYWMDFIQETHDNRDWINAAATTNLRMVLTMGTGGTYTGGGYIRVATEEVAPLALPGAATVQGGTGQLVLS